MALRAIATYRYLHLLIILIACSQCGLHNAKEVPIDPCGEVTSVVDPDATPTAAPSTATSDDYSGVTATVGVSASHPIVTAPPAEPLLEASATPSIPAQSRQLLQAAQRGDVDTVSSLLSAAPATNEYRVLKAIDEQGNTPLHKAAERGHTHLMDPLAEAVSNAKRNQWVNRQNARQATALDAAVDHCHPEAVAKLLVLGAHKRNTGAEALPRTPATRVQQRIGALQQSSPDHIDQIQQLEAILKLLGPGESMCP